MSKGPPIPVRFEVDEAEGIRSLATRTRLPEAEIIRRAVRYLLWSVKHAGIGVIYESLEPTARVAETPDGASILREEPKPSLAPKKRKPRAA